MKNKMIKHGIAVIGIAVLIFLSVASATEPPPQPPISNVAYTEVSFSEFVEIQGRTRADRNLLYQTQNQGFIVEGYIEFSYIGLSRNIDSSSSFIYIYGEPNGRGRSQTATLHQGRDIELSHQSEDFLQYRNVGQFMNRIDTSKLYRIYTCLHFTGGSLNMYLDNIEGLMSLDEGAANEAQQRAEREAAEQARRQAEEEANRYDPSKFTLVPSNFRPANYT